jgi:hypothetical protein
MAKVIMIEGPRNVGKTFLIKSLGNKIPTYKFPFAKYFNESFSKVNTDEPNSIKELFYLTLGYDITILDLAKQGLLKEDLIVDRGILSNIIYGIQSGRISEDEGFEAWKWLNTEYKDYFSVIYIDVPDEMQSADNRNKDMWQMYDNTKTRKIYEDFILRIDKYFLDTDQIHDKNNMSLFINNYSAESVTRFKLGFDNI